MKRNEKYELKGIGILCNKNNEYGVLSFFSFKLLFSVLYAFVSDLRGMLNRSRSFVHLRREYAVCMYRIYEGYS